MRGGGLSGQERELFTSPYVRVVFFPCRPTDRAMYFDTTPLRVDRARRECEVEPVSAGGWRGERREGGEREGGPVGVRDEIERLQCRLVAAVKSGFLFKGRDAAWTLFVAGMAIRRRFLMFWPPGWWTPGPLLERREGASVAGWLAG